MTDNFANPFRPGAGHPPPYLAGRTEEQNQLRKLLEQDTILENMVLTGLRGTGKTVLLDTLRPIAQQANWIWVSSDLSESTCVAEENTALRLITDISIITANMASTIQHPGLGFGAKDTHETVTLNFDYWKGRYTQIPGLVADKLKGVIEEAWMIIQKTRFRGVVFAYDEAQNMSDKPDKDQYPLAMLLDVFQSVQRKGVRFMLVLTGLPTLFPKLVEARTFAERMFTVVTLSRLLEKDSRDAILKPIDDASCPVKLDTDSVNIIIQYSVGYPYFIQFICKEVYDVFLQKIEDKEHVSVPMAEIERKLDTDFFAGRWSRASDRQRDLLRVIAGLESADQEFTVQEIVERSKTEDGKPFGASHVNQMLSSLTKAGLIYKNRHGKYSFAVPLFERFIQRQENSLQATLF